MMNLGILNTIIAMVIVLLVLSLIVQAIQMFLKKLLKLKSRQLVESLEDLYEQALSITASSPAPGPAGAPIAGKSRAQQCTVKIGGEVKKEPMVQAIQAFFKRVSKIRSGIATTDKKSPAEEFTAKILGEFKDIGRESRRGEVVLDSLSKGDLLKIMARLESESFVPGYVAEFQMAVNDLAALKTVVEKLAAEPTLRGAASAKVAAIRGVLAPLFNDVRGILDEHNVVKTNVVFGDLLRLRKLNLNGIPELLNDAQQAITEEIGVAVKSTPPLPVDDLQAVSKELAKIANLVGDLSQKFDKAVAPLRIKLEQVETWYDTVMQSFDERYTRHMRSVAIYISIDVVVLLNADFFKVYSNLSKNQVQTNLIVQNGPRVLEEVQKAEEANKTDASQRPTPSPTPAPTLAATPVLPPSTSVTTPAMSASPMATSPTSTPTPAPVDIKKEAEETKQNIEVYVNMYEEFGFSPLSAEQVRSWLWSTGGWTWFLGTKERGGIWGFTMARSEKGVPLNAARKPIARDCHEIDNDGKEIKDADGQKIQCSSAWRPMTSLEWWASRKHDASALFGWSIMVLLLSVGAPFWQDTLESLFGIKNLLRQKSGTQNIETASGAGQPRQ